MSCIASGKRGLSLTTGLCSLKPWDHLSSRASMTTWAARARSAPEILSGSVSIGPKCQPKWRLRSKSPAAAYDMRPCPTKRHHSSTSCPQYHSNMDFVSVEPDSSNTKDILVITDHFTAKYAVAVSTLNQKARTVAKSLWDHCFILYSIPVKSFKISQSFSWACSSGDLWPELTWN